MVSILCEEIIVNMDVTSILETVDSAMGYRGEGFDFRYQQVSLQANPFPMEIWKLSAQHKATTIVLKVRWWSLQKRP